MSIDLKVGTYKDPVKFVEKYGSNTFQMLE